MATHRNEITINPYKGDSRPKKITDHLHHTRNAAMPISIYRTVHTGANTQFGGLKAGFSSVAYQVGMALRENMEPMAPAARQATILTTSFRIYFFAFFA